MFKVIKAEFNKMLAKPGIYVLAVLLALVLILGIFVYQPTEYKVESITVEGTTYTDKYTNFNNVAIGEKAVADSALNTAIYNISLYNISTINGEKTQKEYLNSLKSKFDEYFKEYEDLSVLKTQFSATQTKEIQTKMLNAFNDFVVAVDNTVIANAQFSYPMIQSKTNREKFVSIQKEIKNLLNQEVSSKESLRTQCSKYKNNLKADFDACINNFIYPTLSQNFVNDFTSNKNGSKLNILYNRLNEITDKMSTINALAIKNENNSNLTLAAQMDELANQYINTINTFTNLAKYELISNAFASVSTSEQLDILHLSELSEFNSNSLKIKYNFLFQNNKNSTEYANPLTIGVTSNSSTNAFDYAYFVLRLFSFVIIFYAIMNACFSIAGEIKEGSMRYFAIRPVKRHEILLGKLLAILSLSAILIVFSSIIAILVGGFVYGFASLNILTIFNGTHAIILHPLAMLFIYLISMFIELTIYALIALLLSNLIKSDLLSVTISLVLCVINILLPVFITGFNTWLTFYPLSHITLYSLFGSSIYAPQNDFFNLLLGAKVYAGTNIILTLSVVIILIVTLTLACSKLFKKKEL